GVVLANDFGDAPSTYGPAGAIVQPRFTGGAVSSSSSPGQDLFSSFSLANQVAPPLRLGANVDYEGAPAFSSNALGDDSVGAPDDEDVVTIPAAGFKVRAGESLAINDVACNATSSEPGFVAGWADLDGDGAFGDDERSNVVACPTGGGSVNLTFDVPEELPATASGSLASFLRLRIAPTAA